jgi:hypothetical protein
MANRSYRQLSHFYIGCSPADEAFGVRLAQDLRDQQQEVWIPAFSIEPPEKWLDRGIEAQSQSMTARAYLAVLSPTAQQILATASDLTEHGVTIIALHYQDCDLPAALHDAPCVDFRGAYAPALEQLVALLNKTTTPASA